MLFKNKIYSKIFAAGMLAVFLFAPLQFPQASAETKVIFSVKFGFDANTIISKYNLTNVKRLYSNPAVGTVVSANVSDSDEILLKGNPNVQYVENDAQISNSDFVSSAPITVNDPFFTTDSNLEDKQWYLPKTRVPEAWNYSKGSSSVIVAIVDTGIHAKHLDLNDGRVIAGYDFVNDLPIAADTDSDDNGHGTAVSGVIGAIPNNQKGISGINWDVSLMPVKTLDADGNGDLSVISQGIIWAADHGANIINMSLGGSGFPNNVTMANAIAYAFNKGVLIVAAAGNDTANQGANLDTNPVYPVCADNGQNMILGVAASDYQDRKATFSNFGINCVDITAPGKKILTTAYLPSDPSDNILIYASGTSLATPVVAGIAALIKAQNPSLTNVQIRDLITKTANNIDSLNQDNCLGTSCNGFLGKGRINALLALQPLPILNDTLVREQSTGNVYLVSGGTKHYVSNFVLTQKYQNIPVINEIQNQLGNYTLGQAIAPNTGTLVKGQTDSTVYYIDNGVRRPLTYLVFLSRKFNFANVQVLSEPDLDAIPLADWYWPPDGTLVLIKGNPTVYVMDQQVVRPVTYFVFTQRKLSFAKVITVSQDEFSHVPKAPDTYWLAPIDGTLVKSPVDATVFVIENAAKHAISGTVFTARKYKFANIKTLPQAEMDVIKPGNAILTP